jgi:hypothetical protein
MGDVGLAVRHFLLASDTSAIEGPGIFGRELQRIVTVGDGFVEVSQTQPYEPTAVQDGCGGGTRLGAQPVRGVAIGQRFGKVVPLKAPRTSAPT